MPDSIAHVNIGGVSYLVTANEGDATEWEEFENIAEFSDVKENIEAEPELFKGMTAEEAEKAFEQMKNSGDYDKLEVLTDRGNDAIYTLGGRSFSIWKATQWNLSMTAEVISKKSLHNAIQRYSTGPMTMINLKNEVPKKVLSQKM